MTTALAIVAAVGVTTIAAGMLAADRAARAAARARPTPCVTGARPEQPVTALFAGQVEQTKPFQPSGATAERLADYGIAVAPRVDRPRRRRRSLVT